jgi:predicted SprT family Zn-dependent metalloprotease
MDVTELREVARQKMAESGLHGWTFALSQAKRRLGVCKHRARRIEIGEYYARHNPAETVLDTLLHEIAHALAGPGAGHGPQWRAIAVRLGATPRACDTSPETVVHPGDWQATCPSCERTYHRYRRPVSTSGYRCRCEGRSPLTFEFVGDPARMPPVPTTTGDAARWEARCAGCGTVHLRVRRPKQGRWRCKCPHRCEITWRPRSG